MGGEVEVLGTQLWGAKLLDEILVSPENFRKKGAHVNIRNKEQEKFIMKITISYMILTYRG